MRDLSVVVGELVRRFSWLVGLMCRDPPSCSCGQSQEPFGAILACEGPLRGRVTVPEAGATHPESARERPEAPGNPGVWPLKKLQPWLLAAAAAQQHSCELWGTPLHARGTVADS